MNHQFTGRAFLADTEPVELVRISLTAAKWSFPFWASAFPEANLQAPLREALQMVERFCETKTVIANAKEIATVAYTSVSKCDLPHGDRLRSAGFSVSHIAMTPWFYSMGKLSNLRDACSNSINYAHSISVWAGDEEQFVVLMNGLASSMFDARS
jgi:hypothetical protein